VADWTKIFYRSAIWLKKRADILSRDNNECQKCKSKGKFKKATCVHHKKHLKDRPDLALVDDNLISLCDSCHCEEHPEKLHQNQKKKLMTVERW
jgi:5-methylcytosine-specific restriction endonuclease McrA